MIKYIHDIIAYVNQEIANGNEAKFYAYCPQTLRLENQGQTPFVSDNANGDKDILVTSADYEAGKFACPFDDFIPKQGKGSGKAYNVSKLKFGIHRLVDVHDDISFVNFKGEVKILHCGDKIRIFTTKLPDSFVIRSVDGISAEEFRKTYKPCDKEGNIIYPSSIKKHCNAEQTKPVKQSKTEMIRHIDNIIRYVKKEIDDGNYPKFYAYCPNAIRTGAAAEKFSLRQSKYPQKGEPSSQKTAPNIPEVPDLNKFYRRNCADFKYRSIYGIHQLIDIHENISFTNSKGETEIVPAGGKIRLFTTQTDVGKNHRSSIIICSVKSVSEPELREKYRPCDEMREALEAIRAINKKYRSSLITPGVNVR